MAHSLARENIGISGHLCIPQNNDVMHLLSECVFLLELTSIEDKIH